MLKVPDSVETGGSQAISWHPRRWLQFLRLIGLDTGETKRVGWSAIGFSHSEQDSISEHTYNLSLESFLWNLHLRLEEEIECLDEATMISMPTNHDVTELRGGDIGTPRGQQYPDLKIASREIELIAQQEYCTLLKNDIIARKYTALVENERDQKSDEARVIKLLDRLEAWLHLQKRDPSNWCKAHNDYFNNTIRKSADSIENARLRIAAHKLIDSFIRLHKQGRLGRRRPEEKPKDSSTDRLVVLFQELQLTKAIGRSSWAAAGLKSFEHDNLAQHGHAGVTATWLIGEAALERGLNYDPARALALGLIRDIGKLYGGDVSVASIDPNDPMRHASRRIRQQAFEIIVGKLKNDAMRDHLGKLHEEAMKQETHMSRSQMAAARVMDLMFYDQARTPNYRKKAPRNFFERYRDKKLMPLISGMSDPGLRDFHQDLIEHWLEAIQKGETRKPLHTILGNKGDRACLK